ncbi:MAG TPA: hypothetical protein PLX22_07865 [Spirochaetota bacterium]|nr:hypothetical protein [Spirochaetota bacterium]HOF13870.1 hypothetical protein [Spirochaetota bacterium]HOT19856.1 hypothetical protein [Spirochaetota bacterium]HRR61156.1 hypothetical protein [Spirochaetota bacterium]HRV14973.1 hypothetical protein [Spirochaetota bacterium]
MATEKPGYGDSYSETTTRKRAMNSIMERSMDMAVENTVMAGYAVTKGDGVAMVLDITFQWEMRIFVEKK